MQYIALGPLRSQSPAEANNPQILLIRTESEPQNIPFVLLEGFLKTKFLVL